MIVRCMLLLSFLAATHTAMAQGIMGDVFAGKLIDPEVGVFAWYDLTDTATGKQFYLRLAIVGEEKVKGKTGHWFEVRLLPRVGFPAVYKLLLTGPASDPKNVHRILMKEGNSEPVELDTASLSEGSEKSAAANRKDVGQDVVETQSGTLTAEHIVVVDNDLTTDIWLNNEVRPMGLVKMKNPQGELVLRNYGEGVANTGSIFDDPLPNGIIDEPIKSDPENADTVTTVVEGVETPTSEEPVMQEAPTENTVVENAPPTTTIETEVTPTETQENAAALEANEKEADEKNKKKSAPKSQRRGVGGKR